MVVLDRCHCLRDICYHDAEVFGAVYKTGSPRNMFVLPKEIGDLGEIPIFIEEQKYQ